VNNAKFETSQICQIFSFLCSPDCKVFRVEILHVRKAQHYLHLDFFNLKNAVFNFEKKQGMCSLGYTLGFP
jgi:hypothetical protein